MWGPNADGETFVALDIGFDFYHVILRIADFIGPHVRISVRLKKSVL